MPNDESRNIARQHFFRLAFLIGVEREPEETVGRKGDQIGQVANARKVSTAQHLLRDSAFPVTHIEFDSLRGAGHVCYAEDRFGIELPHIRENSAVGWPD